MKTISSFFSAMVLWLWCGCGVSYEYRLSSVTHRDKEIALKVFDATARQFHGTVTPPDYSPEHTRPVILHEYTFSRGAAEAAATFPNATTFRVYLRLYSYEANYSSQHQFQLLAAAMKDSLERPFGAARIRTERQFHYDPDPFELFGIFPVAP